MNVRDLGMTVGWLAALGLLIIFASRGAAGIARRAGV